MIVNKPWGHEEIWAETDKYVGKILHINKGHQLSRQYHKVKDESIYVLKGLLILELGEDPIEVKILKEGQNYRITPNTVHRFRSLYDPVTLVEVSTPEVDDVVRLQDEYGRA
mgnify:CR=1 FL=1